MKIAPEKIRGLILLKFKNVKEYSFFNIFSEKPENTIVLKMA